MAIDFRQSLDRTLAAFARPQRIVRRALAAGTRQVRGADDSRGALHRAAAGPTLLTQTVYALTYLVAPGARRAAADERERAEIYVRMGEDTYAVCLVKADQPAADDDTLPEWQASRIVRVDAAPCA